MVVGKETKPNFDSKTSFPATDLRPTAKELPSGGDPLKTRKITAS